MSPIDIVLIILAIIFAATCIFEFIVDQKLEAMDQNERDIRQAIRIANSK